MILFHGWTLLWWWFLQTADFASPKFHPSRTSKGRIEARGNANLQHTFSICSVPFQYATYLFKMHCAQYVLSGHYSLQGVASSSLCPTPPDALTNPNMIWYSIEGSCPQTLQYCAMFGCTKFFAHEVILARRNWRTRNIVSFYFSAEMEFFYQVEMMVLDAYSTTTHCQDVFHDQPAIPSPY